MPIICSYYLCHFNPTTNRYVNWKNHFNMVLSVGANAPFALKQLAAPPISFGVHLNPVPFLVWLSLCCRNPAIDFSDK